MSSTIRTHLSNRLSSLASRTDNLLTHLSRLLSTSQGIEASLCTLCYTLTLLHALLKHRLEKQYERLALRLASKASESILPGETVVASISTPHTRLSETCAGIKAGANLIEDFRIFTRLWGLLTIYTGARETYLQPPKDAMIKTLVWAEVGTSVGFQFLENCAYLASKGVLRGDGWMKGRETKWMAWSNRFWMAQVLLSALRLLRVRQLRYNEDFGAESKKSDDGDAMNLQSKALEKKWKLDFYANAGWFPLTLHWSFEDESRSPVSEAVLGLCGIVPGVIGFREVWQETA